MARYLPSALRCARRRTAFRSLWRIGRFLPDGGVTVADSAIASCSADTDTRWFSTCQYPSAQKMRLATAIAPVAASGWPAASNDTNQRSLAESRIVKPGANPASFGDTTFHLPAAGPSPTSGPRAISSSVTGRARMRLVNQPESGTSSIVLTFRARTSGVESPGRPKRLVARSMVKSMSHSSTFAASCVSGSRDSGSSSRNRRLAPDGPTAATSHRLQTVTAPNQSL